MPAILSWPSFAEIGCWSLSRIWGLPWHPGRSRTIRTRMLKSQTPSTTMAVQSASCSEGHHVHCRWISPWEPWLRYDPARGRQGENNGGVFDCSNAQHCVSRNGWREWWRGNVERLQEEKFIIDLEKYNLMQEETTYLRFVLSKWTI